MDVSTAESSRHHDTTDTEQRFGIYMREFDFLDCEVTKLEKSFYRTKENLDRQINFLPLILARVTRGRECRQFQLGRTEALPQPPRRVTWRRQLPRFTRISRQHRQRCGQQQSRWSKQSLCKVRVIFLWLNVSYVFCLFSHLMPLFSLWFGWPQWV